MEVRLLSEVLTKRLKGVGLGAFISLATKWECLHTVCCCYFELPEVKNCSYQVITMLQQYFSPQHRDDIFHAV